MDTPLATAATAPRFSSAASTLSASSTKARHSPSLSSPPSLGAPFPKSDMLSPTSTTFASSGSIRKLSTSSIPLTAEGISYPTIVSRSDDVPTFTPSGPAPTPLTAKEKSQQDDVSDAIILTAIKRGSKSRPAPLKIPSSNHTFLSPLLEKTGISNKFGFGAGKDGTEKPHLSRSKSGRKGSKVDSIYTDPKASLAENQAAFAEYYPATTADVQQATGKDHSRKDSGYGSNSAGLIPSSGPVPIHTISHRPVERIPVPVSREWPQTPQTAVPNSILTPPPPPSAPRRVVITGHRRATSADQSPQMLQQAGFAPLQPSVLSSRPVSHYIPSTIQTATRRTRRKASDESEASIKPPQSADNPNLASLRSQRRASSTASSSAGSGGVVPPRKGSNGRIEDSFTSTHRGSPPPPPGASTSRRPSAANAPQMPSHDHVNISVKQSVGSSSSREIARPALTSDGVTIVMTSQHRPEDFEVGWTCSSGVSENGLPFSTFSFTLKPKAIPVVQIAAASPPEQRLNHQQRCEAVAAQASLFSYRLGTDAASSPSIATEEPGSPKSSPAPVEIGEALPSTSISPAHATCGSTPSDSPDQPPLTPAGPWLVTPADAAQQRRGSRVSSNATVLPSPTKDRFDRFVQQQTPSGALGLGFHLGPNSNIASSPTGRRSPSFGEAEPRTPTKARPQLSLLPESARTRTRQDSIFVAGILGVDEHQVDSSLAMLQSIPTPNPQANSSSDDGEGSDEENATVGVSKKDMKLAIQRQRSRMMSKWSDTDADEEEDADEIEPGTPDLSKVEGN